MNVADEFVSVSLTEPTKSSLSTSGVLFEPLHGIQAGWLIANYDT